MGHFEFTGKIDSATFVDRENTTIELLFKRDKDSNELYVYNLSVDYGADDFKGFLEEWSLEQVERETRIVRRAADEAFDKMIQGRVAEELAKGQRLLDEQDKRRYTIAQKTLDKQDQVRWLIAQKKLDEQDKERYAIAQKDMEAYKKKLEADVDKIDKERYEKVEAYKKKLEADVDKTDKERYQLADAYKTQLETEVEEIDKERYAIAQTELDKQDKERYAIAQTELDKQDKERYAIAEKTLEDQDKERRAHFEKDMAAYKKKLEADIDKTDNERYELAEAYKKELEYQADIIDKSRYDLADEYKKRLEEKVDKNEQERIELWRLNNPTATKAVVASDLLMYADQFNENKNFLFDLKLAIFEDPTIGKLKDKAAKLAIRKSRNIYEVFELYCKLKKNYVQTGENVI